MTPQEHQMLDDFLDRLARVGSVAKDPAADALIRERLAGQPDAPYLLVQRALLLQQALDDAQRRIAQLMKQATAQAPAEGSFLSPAVAPEPGFGRAPSQNYMPPPASFPPAAAVQPPTAPAGGWRERLFGAPAPTAPLQAVPAGGGSGFLGQAAATAAGVAGGMFLFNGLQHWGEHAGGAAKHLVDGSSAAPTAAGAHEDPANHRIGDALGPRDDASAGSGSASPFLSDNGNYDDAARQTVADDGSGSWLVDDGGFADDDSDNFI